MTDGALVLGGAGFIGTHLLADLAARGVSPLISLDLNDPLRPVTGVDYRRGDVRRPFDDLVPEIPATVYNLAAVHRTPGHPDHAYYDTNVAGAVNACAFGRRRGVPRIVFTSSIAVYGPREEPCDEDTPLAPVSAYGRSKALAEAIHREWVDAEPDRRLVIARPSVVFGEGENGNVERLLRQLRRGAFVYPGRRDTIKGCGWVGELVRALDFAATRNDHVFVFNFAYPEPYTIERIAETLADVAGVARPRFAVPNAVIMAAAMGFEALNWIGLRNGINRDRVRKLQISTNTRPRRLIEAGYRFETDLEAGLRGWLRRPRSDMAADRTDCR
ncbi:MAG: NAD(P)-dependent oxidoreductase [Alphaproteobacteria bacterium]|nr:NAD(P)-dependent oxidoreductase [Alphaproteobacteria bacterium]